jgi:hypothetical protein
MLKSGELVSALLNLCIAVYLIHFYPRSLKRQLQGRPMPPLFRLLAKAIPVVGYLLAAGTILYVMLRLSGVIAA